ncbi:mycofactocin biosynthesis glycosyltransferase MftF [Pseudonocardia sp. KRD291]|uniref:mycofactocin biosynthesis glycosyltransferase MftF n=1 Tax=Pseudonocardia sp. KRD291 TaxID=2792007 RepID=UPI001C4A4A92|nr:mycofactocin biosynthesis glycosyltransferase MftF [Pseudonocardia sp. KRD291]MBW0105335.1 mycofactocin biosynthesis glycosyltransferase MftF [Pseudonocardia sp. KRD291]
MDLPATADGPHDLRLPDAFRVVLDRRVRRVDGGAALLGGAPPRLMYLSRTARDLLPAGPRTALTVTDPTTRALARRLLDSGLAHPAFPVAADHEPDGEKVPGAEDVTVVVPVKDRPLLRLLSTLPANLGGLVVVDDGSDDPRTVADGVAEAGGTVLRHERPRGPAAARNAGVAAADTAFVVFLDSDVVPEPGWLAPLLAHAADPAVALVAPRIVALGPVPDRGGVNGAIARYEAVRSSLDLGPDPALIVPRSRVAYVPSAAMLVRVDAVPGPGDGERRTAFDEDMHVAEDVDLVLRLHAAGWRMRYEPAARVAHDHRTDPAEWLLRKAFYGTGAAPLAQRHPGAVPPVVLSPWSAAVCVLLLAQRRWSVAGAAAVTAVATERLSRKLTRLDHPRRCAARLTALGLSGAVWQVGSALTRHFWPVVVLALPFSSRARRAVAVAALAEGLADWWVHRDRDRTVRPGPVGFLLAHRLDDMAYGAGLWAGALRRRTTAPLRPTGPGTAPKATAKAK